MIDRILDRAERLSTFPELGVRASEAEDENVREIFEASYRILYLAQPSRVDILAIVHGRQDITWRQKSHATHGRSLTKRCTFYDAIVVKW